MFRRKSPASGAAESEGDFTSSATAKAVVPSYPTYQLINSLPRDPVYGATPAWPYSAEPAWALTPEPWVASSCISLRSWDSTWAFIALLTVVFGSGTPVTSEGE